MYRANVPHQQYYPQAGWVEHDAEEIYDNVVKAISQLPLQTADRESLSLAITNQRETVVSCRSRPPPVNHFRWPLPISARRWWCGTA